MSHNSPVLKDKPQITPVGAGVAGAIAGAALGAAAAVVLSDEENRKKLKKNIGMLKKKAIKALDSLEDTDIAKVVEKKADEAKEMLEKSDLPTNSR